MDYGQPINRRRHAGNAPIIAAHRIASTTEAADRINELVEALRVLVPTNISNNRNVPDDFNLPCDITMGELRQAWAALAKAGATT